MEEKERKKKQISREAEGARLPSSPFHFSQLTTEDQSLKQREYLTDPEIIFSEYLQKGLRRKALSFSVQ